MTLARDWGCPSRWLFYSWFPFCSGAGDGGDCAEGVQQKQCAPTRCPGPWGKTPVFRSRDIWYGSGSSDSYLWPTDPDADLALDPALFVSYLQDANKKLFKNLVIFSINWSKFLTVDIFFFLKGPGHKFNNTGVFCSMLFTVSSSGRFYRKPYSTMVLKLHTKKPAQQENLNSIVENRKTRVEN